MAEAGGLAVGAVSLGIQVCQGLIKYYTQFKGAKDDIDAVIKSVESLRASLQAWESVMTKVADPNNPVSKQAEKAIKDLEDGLARLDAMRKKFLETKPTGSLQEKIKYAKSRLSYPFRKDTLNELQKVVDRLQANFQLAVHHLGIDVMDDHLNNQDVALQCIQRGIKDLGTSQQQETALITTELKRQTSLLNVQKASLNTVERGMTALSVSVQDQGSSVRLQLTTQNSQIENHTTLLQDIRGDTNVLITSLESQNSNLANLAKQLSRHIEVFSQRSMAPAELYDGPASQSVLPEDALTSYLETHPFQRELRRYNHVIKRSKTVARTESTSCTCRGYGQRKRSYVEGWLFSTLSQSHYTHAPECPLFPHADFSVEVEKQFRVHSRLLLSVGFTRLRKGSGLTMFPYLSFRAVVSKDSPAFRLLDETLRDLCWDRNPSSSVMETTFSSLSISMRRIIGENPSRASDTLPNGENLLHRACSGILPLDLRAGPDAIIRLLSLLVELKVPVDGRNDFGRVPVDWLLWNPCEDEGFQSARSFLLDKMDSWQFAVDWDFMYPDLSTLMASLLAIESLSEKFEAESDYQEAILQRSVPKLQHVLHRTKARWDCASPDSGGYNLEEWVYYALWWQEGARLIFETARSQSGPTLRWTSDRFLRDCVRWRLDPGSCRFWVQQGCPVTSATWAAACKSTWAKSDHNAILGILAHQLRKNAQDPAERAALQSLYHVYNLPKFAAARLWDAGFREADLDEYHDSHGTRKAGTPLWEHSQNRWMSSKHLDLLEWLVGKGARLDWSHPRWGTTPRTSISKSLWRIFHTKLTSVTRKFLSTVFWSSSPDKCDCLCSEGGCIPFACAFDSGQFNSDSCQFCSDSGQFYPDNGDLQHGDQLFQTIAHAVLRRATFDALNMTHTCCSRNTYLDEYFGELPLQSAEDILEVQHVESQDAQLLEILTAKFNRQSEQYEGTLVQFFQKIWIPRMDDILVKRDSEIPSTEKIQELGIHLEEMSEAHSEDQSAHLNQVSVTYSESEPETYHLEELFEPYPDYESVHLEEASETYFDYVPSHPRLLRFVKCARREIWCVPRTGSIRRLGQVCSCWRKQFDSSDSEYEFYTEE